MFTRLSPPAILTALMYQAPRTLESTRETDDTVVTAEDVEVLRDEAGDEFAGYFDGSATPKIMVTTRPRPSSVVFGLIKELLGVIPNAFYYARGELRL
jgi:ribosome production factor 1